MNGNIAKTVQSRDYQYISKAMDNLKLTENVVESVELKNEIINFHNLSMRRDDDRKKEPDFKIEASLKKSILYLWFLFNRFNNG